MIRVVRAGGWVVVVDKQASYRRRLRAEPWESWPDRQVLERTLARHCTEVSVVPVGRDGRPPDPVMLAWRGRKRSPATGSGPDGAARC